jgi:hypothetical protein
MAKGKAQKKVTGKYKKAMKYNNLKRSRVKIFESGGNLYNLTDWKSKDEWLRERPSKAAEIYDGFEVWFCSWCL